VRAGIGRRLKKIVLGEQLGFESAWLAESVFYPTRPMSNPLMVAIAAAQRTERIRFGTLQRRRPFIIPFIWRRRVPPAIS